MHIKYKDTGEKYHYLDKVYLTGKYSDGYI